MMIISDDAFAAISAIVDGIDPKIFKINYLDAVGAIINQHGFNLFWGGLVTIVGDVFIWRLNTAAIFISALVGGLLDVGYFTFIDLGGYSNFFPGRS